MSVMRSARGPALARFLVVAGGLALADQLIKAVVVREMALNESRPLLGSWLSLTRQANTGAAFGMFPWASSALVLVSAVVVVILVVWAFRSAAQSPGLALPLSLILGGALGNLLDRACRGLVVDYLDVHVWPVFNLADIALTVGVIWFGFRLVCCSPSGQQPAAPEEDA